MARGIPPGRQSGNRPQPTWPHNRRPLFSPTVSRTTASRKPHSSTTSSSNGTLDPCWLHDITSSPSHQTTQVTASISHRFSPSSRLELPARSDVDSWADSQATGRNHRCPPAGAAPETNPPRTVIYLQPDSQPIRSIPHITRRHLSTMIYLQPDSQPNRSIPYAPQQHLNQYHWFTSSLLVSRQHPSATATYPSVNHRRSPKP